MMIGIIIIGGMFYAQQIFGQENNSFKSPLNNFTSSTELPVDGNEKKVIVLYKSDITKEEINFLKNKNGKIKSQFKIIPAVALSIDEKYFGEIKANKNVVDIFPDDRVHATLISSVPQINANQVHSNGFTGSGVKTCILDTGIDHLHPAFDPTAVVAEKDFVNNDNDASDDEGHGTHVAAIVASTDSTYRGVAFGSSLMIGKVLDDTGSGFISDVISGIGWCVNNGAQIISMSLGANFNQNTACDNEPIAQASNNAFDLGVVVVAATGNDGRINKIDKPACGSKVIAVGAVDINDGRTSFSNEGTQLEIVAPGVGIVSAALGGGFVPKTGTSMATPHVSGTAALILQEDPTKTPTEVRAVLQATAVDLGASGFDTIYGYGRVNALDAVPALDIEGLCGRPASSFNVIMGTLGDDVLLGTVNDDLIIGNDGNDKIIGFEGDDCLIGQGGADFIQGREGNDIIFGGAGIDHINGNDGNDIISGGTENDYVNGGGGNDTINGDAGNDYLHGGSGDDIIDGGEGNDYINGNHGANSIMGGAGDDTILGGKDIDIINGGDGNDIIIAWGSADTINGNAGNDYLNGGKGDDTITGGPGDDVLIGAAGIDNLDGGDGYDVCLGTAINCELPL